MNRKDEKEEEKHILHTLEEKQGRAGGKKGDTKNNENKKRRKKKEGKKKKKKKKICLPSDGKLESGAVGSRGALSGSLLSLSLSSLGARCKKSGIFTKQKTKNKTKQNKTKHTNTLCLFLSRTHLFFFDW